MKNKLFLAIFSFCWLSAANSFGQTVSFITNIYSRDTDGFACYRIPAIVKSLNGTILAFAEARKNSCSDTGDIDLVLKRSTDGGRTWSETITVWNDGANVCGNPAPVVDRQTGRILLLSTWNRGDLPEGKTAAGFGEDSRRVFCLYSDDEGRTWSQPEEITSFVKRPEWAWYATGPCHGIQLQTGKYRNRIVIPANHDVKRAKERHSHVICSDDSGKTWRLGGVVAEKGGNESSVVELKNGHLMLNMRNYNRDASPTRAYAISKDGGETWSEMRYAPELIEPVCQGSIIHLVKKRKITATLLFSNPASTDKRKNMTVRMSHDSGKSWKVAIPVYSGPTAYSDMLLLDDNHIGLLYEYGKESPYEQIGFATIRLPVRH
ncbi:MAG: glycoside hydrolase [Bacteroidales bacterium]|jgi:sialidase-1|nr:glycoside hydrolase [Bacteroidales bacterium]